MSLCLNTTDFLDAFLPIPPEGPLHPRSEGLTFDGVLGFASERDLAERWVRCVNNSRSQCRGYVVCLSEECWGPTEPRRTQVDGAFYTRRKHPIDGRPHWGRQRALVEFTTGGVDVDPFYNLWRSTHARQRAAIAAYVSHVMARQQRTAHFSFIINNTVARVVRWEHAGPTFTEPFDYVQNPELMCEFLWRFSMLSDEDQGFDFSAKLLGKRHKWYKLMDTIARGPLEGQPEDLSEDEGTVVPFPGDPSSSASPLRTFKYVRQMFAASLDDDWPRYRVAVPTDRPGRFKYFLIGKPTVQAPKMMIGEGPRGYVAVDVETKRFVWLKDTWRPYYAGVDTEGDILRRLHAAQVPNISTVLCAGDIRQETQMHYHWKPDTTTPARDCELKRSRSGQPTAGGQQNCDHFPRNLSHYRLVLREVCLRLVDFKTSRQLIQAVLDSLEAHEGAVNKANILHRNISIDCILILPTVIREDECDKVKWTGVLSDWDQSKDIVEEGKRERARQPVREANWKFMSAALQWWDRLPGDVEDDLESFFNVILYAGVRFLRSNFRENGDDFFFLKEYFDKAYWGDGKKQCSLQKYDWMSRGTLRVRSQELRFLPNGQHPTQDPHIGDPMNTILTSMLSLFRARYDTLEYEQELFSWSLACTASWRCGQKPEPPTGLPQSVQDAALQLETHTHFKELLRRLLEKGDWPTKDYYVGDIFGPRDNTLNVNSTLSSSNNAGDASNDSTSDDGDDERPIKRTKVMTDGP